MGLTITKLSRETEEFGIGEGNYSVWRRNRKNKQGGGVMLMVKTEKKNCRRSYL